MRNRVKEMVWVDPKSIVANPKNWRTHPDGQRAAFREILATVGMSDVLLAYRREDGVLVLIDGHLRLSECKNEEKVAVAVLDVTAKEADLILATYDPLGGMAETDQEAMEALNAEVLKAFDLEDDSAIKKMLIGAAVYEKPGTKSSQREPTEAADANDYVLSFGKHKIPLTAEYADLVENSIVDWCESVGLKEGWSDALVRNLEKNQKLAAVKK